MRTHFRRLYQALSVVLLTSVVYLFAVSSGRASMSAEGLGSNEIVLGRATLLAARTALGVGSRSQDGSPIRYRVLPSRAAITEAVAATALTKLAKPIVCRAAWSEHTIELDCEQVLGRDEEGRSDVHVNAAREMAARLGVNGSVRVEGGDDSIVMSLTELENWRRNYRLIGVSTALIELEPDVKTTGLVAVLRLARSGTVHLFKPRSAG